MTLGSDAKFEEKLTFGLENNIKNLANFHQCTCNSQNRDFDGIFVQSWKYFSLKCTGELCVIRMENDAKIEEELTSLLKIGMNNLTNFDSNSQKSQKFVL